MKSTFLGLSALLASAVVSNAESVRVGEWSFYSKGPYSVFNGPFAAGTLKSPTDYEDATFVEESTFPAGATISWRWPATSCQAVCGFMQIAFGNYNGGPTNLIPSHQIRDITTLLSTHDLSFNFNGAPNGSDIIYDVFLTAQTGNTAHAAEIEVFLHTPSNSSSFAATGTSLGALTLMGVEWKVSAIAAAPPIFVFMPTGGADLPAATIDLKAMLDFLRSKGKLTGSEWYNGHALGAEPRDHSGSIFVRNLAVTYD